jgi:hypothetical protein
MSDLRAKSDGTFEAMIGSNIDSAIAEARRLAIAARAGAVGRKHGEIIVFDFNGVTVNVGPDSDPALIRRDWDRAMSGYIAKVVGPMPKAKLTRQEEQSDARIEAKNKARRDAESARYQAKANQHRRQVETRMKEAPAMEFSNRSAWNAAVATNSSDPYGAGILSYAERWARMMQLEIRQGKKLPSIWESTSFEADLEGMSGASQGMATHLLTQCWVHGAELRRLHNAKWESKSTSGTVNPAIITVRKR